ncbi:MAG: hypothetical protein QXL86_01125 [Candidatus Aenigmatarchaeota archaeon]
MEKIDYRSQTIKILYEKNPLRLSKLVEKFLLRTNLSPYKFDFNELLSTIWSLEDEKIIQRDEISKKFYLTESGKERAREILQIFE